MVAHDKLTSHVFSSQSKLREHAYEGTIHINDCALRARGDRDNHLLVLAENVLDVKLSVCTALPVNSHTSQEQIVYRLVHRECDVTIFRRVKCEYSAPVITLIWLQPHLDATGYSGFQTGQTKCI